jgi:hypothetical protein
VCRLRQRLNMVQAPVVRQIWRCHLHLPLVHPHALLFRTGCGERSTIPPSTRARSPAASASQAKPSEDKPIKEKTRQDNREACAGMFFKLSVLSFWSGWAATRARVGGPLLLRRKNNSVVRITQRGVCGRSSALPGTDCAAAALRTSARARGRVCMNSQLCMYERALYCASHLPAVLCSFLTHA